MGSFLYITGSAPLLLVLFLTLTDCWATQQNITAANNNGQCMVSVIVNLALQQQEQANQMQQQSALLEQLSAQLQEQYDRLQTQSEQLQTLSDQVKSLQDDVHAKEIGLARVKESQAKELTAVAEKVNSLESDLKRNLSDLADSWTDRHENVTQENLAKGRLFEERFSRVESGLGWNSGNLTALKATCSRQGQLQKQQQQELSSLGDQLHSVINDVEWLNANLTALVQLGGSRRKVAVGFMTKMSSNIDGASRGLIKLGTVQYNEGDGYNPHTGYFTAPVAGMYTFFIKTEVDGGKESRLAIMKAGNVRLLYIFGSDKDSFQTPSGQVVVHLARGEKVWVENLTSGTHVADWTRFGGFLVHPDH